MFEQGGDVYLIIFLVMLIELFVVFVISVYLGLNNKDREEGPEDVVVY